MGCRRWDVGRLPGKSAWAGAEYDRAGLCIVCDGRRRPELVAANAVDALATVLREAVAA